MKDFERIYPYLLIIIFVGIVFFGFKALLKKQVKKEFVFEGIGYALWLLVPFLFFSTVSTKLVWYGYPILIPLEVIAAIFIGKFLTEELMDDKNFVIAGKVVFALGLIYLIVTQMYATYLNAVREIHGDEMQLFIAESVERDSEYAGLKAYIGMQP